MKIYRTRYPAERLNLRYDPRREAFRIGARGRSLYITPAECGLALFRVAFITFAFASALFLLSLARLPAPAVTPSPPAMISTTTPEPVSPVTRPPAPEIKPSRYDGITLTEAEIDTLARLVWLEARGEPFDGQVAVVEVVLNRILSPSFPDTVDEVVYQTGPIQFSPAHLIPETTAGEEQYRAVEVAITAAEPITDPDVVYFSTRGENERVFATIGGHVFCRE